MKKIIAYAETEIIQSGSPMKLSAWVMILESGSWRIFQMKENQEAVHYFSHTDLDGKTELYSFMRSSPLQMDLCKQLSPAWKPTA